MNLITLLEMTAQAAPDRIAVTAQGRHVTYGQLLAMAHEFAAGVDPSAKAVAYLGENSPEAVALLFAGSIAGVPYAPINYRWTDAQLAEAMKRIAPLSVLTDADSAHRVPAVDTIKPLVAQSGAQIEPGFPDEESPAVLLFTSGTTSAPKAAVLRNRHLVPYVLETIDFLNAETDEAILVSVPPYHIAAVSSVLTSMFAGRRMVQLTAFSPEAWVQTVRDEAVTQAMVVPTMLNRILDVIEEDGLGLPNLRHLSYGGGRMPSTVVERTMELLPHLDLVNAYGLTETSSTITLLSPADHREAAASSDPSVRARLGSVGRSLPTVEIQVRDDDGNPLPAGTLGEIFVRGDQVSGEYLSHRAISEDGWYPTRDRGYLDEEGFLFLDGRADDVIVRGGENLSPAEIEDRLTAHESVVECAVIGVPDIEWGERVEAFVVPVSEDAADEDTLKKWVREALRSTKVPAAIHFVDELPYNETGKLLRRELREKLTSPAIAETRD